MASLSLPPPPTKTDPNKQRGRGRFTDTRLAAHSLQTQLGILRELTPLRAQKTAERTLYIILWAQATPKDGAKPRWRTHPTWALPKRGQRSDKTREGTGWGQGRGLPSSLTGVEHLGWSVWGQFFFPTLEGVQTGYTKRKVERKTGFPVILTLVHLSRCIYANRITQHRVICLPPCLSVHLSVCLYCIAGAQPMLPLATLLA